MSDATRSGSRAATISDLRVVIFVVIGLVLVGLIVADILGSQIQYLGERLDRVEAMHGTDAAHPDHPYRFAKIRHVDAEPGSRGGADD